MHSLVTQFDEEDKVFLREIKIKQEATSWLSTLSCLAPSNWLMKDLVSSF